MNNFINYSYNYNLRLIPKNNEIKNINPGKVKKLSNSNSLNIPFSNGKPIKLKNKRSLNTNNINRLLIKPKTPDLDNKKNNNLKNLFKINNYPCYEDIKYKKKLINNNINNKNFKRPSTAQQQDTNFNNIKYNYNGKLKNNQKYYKDIEKDNSIFEYNNYSHKRMPSPMIGHQKIMINDKNNQPIKYRAPSPKSISLDLGQNRLIKKNKIIEKYKYFNH